MKRSTLLMLLLAVAVPASAVASANSDESARGCPKAKASAAPAQDSEAPAVTVQGGSSAKPANPRSSGTPAVRAQPQRWHSLLPGMIR